MKRTISLVLAAAFSSAAFGDGNLDPSFDQDGRLLVQVNLDGGKFEEALDVLVDKMGRIYMVGFATDADQKSRFLITRYRSTGTQDGEFAPPTGIALTPAVAGNMKAVAATFDNDGHIVVAGTVRLQPGNSDFMVCRFSSDGDPVPFTGSNQTCVRPVLDLDQGTGDDDFATDVAVDRFGRIIISGQAECMPIKPYCGVIVRLQPNGVFDSFGESGVAVIGGETPSSKDRIAAISIDSSDRIVATGTREIYNPNADAINYSMIGARLTNGGTYDPSWNNGNPHFLKSVGTGIAVDSEGLDVTIDENDNVLLAGVASRSKALVIKLAASNGGRMQSFSGDGETVVSLTQGASTLLVNKIALAHNGDIFLGGAGSPINANDSHPDFAVVKLAADGAIISGFGSNGRRRIDFNSGSDVSYGLAVVPNRGKVVLTGSARASAAENDYAIAAAVLDSDVIYHDEFDR